LDGFKTHLELSERETTTGTYTTVVLYGRAADDRTKLVDRARSDGGGLGLASLSAAELAAGL